MDYSTVENVQTWLQDGQRYIEEHIIRLPRRRTMRTLLIVAAYFILRPWLLKLAGVSAGLNLEKPVQQDEDKSAATEAQQTLQEIMEGKDRPPAEKEADSDQEIENFLRKVIK